MLLAGLHYIHALNTSAPLESSMNARDNVERIESDYSTAESREVAHQAELADIHAADDARMVLGIIYGIKALGTAITPATLDMLLGALMAATKHLPAQHALIEECFSFVECCS